MHHDKRMPCINLAKAVSMPFVLRRKSRDAMQPAHAMGLRDQVLDRYR